MAKLVVHQPNGTVRDVRLDRDRITIGRRPDNDLCLPFPAVSAEHAEIVTVAGDSFLHDMGSTNGTLVNGTRVTRHFLRDRDQIDIGLQQLVYLTNEADTVDPLPPLVVDPVVSEATAHTTDDDPTPSVEVDRELRHTADAVATGDAFAAPVDDLLEDLMASNTGASVAVDMPPTISVVPVAATRSTVERSPDADNDASDGVYVEVMNGPNAGQISPMTRREFVLGKAGVTIAVIRRDQTGHRLVPVNGHPSLNGRTVEPEGAMLAFGDTIDVAGVKLRFGRRAAY